MAQIRISWKPSVHAKNAQSSLSYTTVKSPFDGIVDRNSLLNRQFGKKWRPADQPLRISVKFSPITASPKMNTWNTCGGIKQRPADLKEMNQQVNGKTLQDEQEEISLILSDGVDIPL